jgi:chemotaxis protein methyltransferase CheR
MSSPNDPVPSVATADLSPKSFARFAEFITGELGIKMPETKLTMIQSRLLRRVRELRLRSVEEYGDYFFSSANREERDHFINAVTTNKTDFFREPQHFDFLKETVLARSLAGKLAAGARLQLWSAGCSSGEEPYTLAMVLSEQGEPGRRVEFSILATDVSTKVLEEARKGIYQEAQVAPVPVELRQKYLLRSRDSSEQRVRIRPELRARVSFHRLNFMDQDYRLSDVFDVIFFRNVMIYFDKSTQEAVLNRMCRHLAPGGYLFVGHSESLTGLNIPVVQVRTSIFRKPPAGR